MFNRIKNILLKYGTIIDEAIKFNAPIIVLSYGKGERKLKVEISNKHWDNSYEIKNYLGINMKVMTKPDMFAHKLCAMLDRTDVTNRDIFDSWFFMKNQTSINKAIVETRMKMPLADYIQKCIDQLQSMTDKGMLNGLGELMDEEMKRFVRTELRKEAISLLMFYKEFPIIKELKWLIQSIITFP